MEEQKYQAALEAILFTMGESVEVAKLAAVLEISEDEVRALARKMMTQYETQERGIRLIELEGSLQLCTKTELYDYLIRIAKQPKRQVLTDVLLETLSIIAYKQPITRQEIEKIRGVSCGHAVNTIRELPIL